MNTAKCISILLSLMSLATGSLAATMCYSCAECQEPFSPTSVGPDSLITYNVDVVACPPGFDTCLTNLVEKVETGEVYGVRSCAPSHLCQPGVYYNNDTGMRITTSCCKDDLCISYNYFTFSPLFASSSRPVIKHVYLFSAMLVAFNFSFLL